MISLFAPFGRLLDKTSLNLSESPKFNEISRQLKKSMGAIGFIVFCMTFFIVAINWVWYSGTHPPPAHFFLIKTPDYLVERKTLQDDNAASDVLIDAQKTQKQTSEINQIKNFELITSRSPQMSFERVQNWLMISLREAYNIDFLNYKSQVESSRILFSKKAYDLFVEEMDKNIIKNIRKNKIILSMVPTSTVRLIAQAEYEGLRIWRVEMKGLIYMDGSFTKKVPPKPVIFNVDIMEAPASRTPYGLEIVAITMS